MNPARSESWSAGVGVGGRNERTLGESKSGKSGMLNRQSPKLRYNNKNNAGTDAQETEASLSVEY